MQVSVKVLHSKQNIFVINEMAFHVMELLYQALHIKDWEKKAGQVIVGCHGKALLLILR